MTDHDAAAREPRDVIADDIMCLLDGISESVHIEAAREIADDILSALSASGYQIARTPKVGMVMISRDTAGHALHATRVYRDACLNPAVTQRWAEYADEIQQAIDRAEGDCARP